MTTSSGKPAKMLAYRDGGLEQVVGWEAEVPELTSSLSALRTALSTRDLPDEFDVTVLWYENWFDTLTANQRHLDEWVGDVANGFIVAGGGDPDDVGDDQVFTVDDADIAVGYADRSESERQARADALALSEILGDTGIVHPYDLANDPELLERMAEQYPELRDILARSQRFATDESYGAELVNTLGPQDVRTLADLANTFGLAQDRGLIDGDAYEGFVVPLATILGNADRSGRMDPPVRQALFDMDATDDPAFADLEHDSIQEAQFADMRYRSMALLLHAGDFSPQTTAEMANAIIHDGPVRPEFYDHSGFTNVQFLDEHRELASNQWAAVHALERDDHAANIFFRMDTDEFPGELENLYLMNGDVGLEVAAQRLGVSPDDLRGEVNTTLANAVRGGILEHPLATGTTYAPETTELVRKTIEAAGWEHMDAPDEVRLAMAQVSTPYTVDLAVAAEGGRDDLPDLRLGDLSRDEVQAFFREVSEGREARVALGQNAAALVRQQLGAEAQDIAAGDPYAGGTGEVLSSAYYRELGESWDHIQLERVERREALVAAWQSVTDPVVELVSGQIVHRIPVVGTVAELPGVDAIVDGITEPIRDSINDAIYDNAIPPPVLESMEGWRDGAGDQIHTAVATSLYEHEATREHFLRQAQAENDPALARITADGTVTLAEFRELQDVRDAVNSHGGDILTSLEASMAFDKGHD